MSASIDTNKTEISHDSMPLSRVTVSGEQKEYVILGGKKYLKSELQTAFGGTLNPDRYSTEPVNKFGNAAALGLGAFSLTAFVLGLYVSNCMGVKVPSVIFSMCLFHGGVVQLLAGIWELVIGNTFAGTALTSYGAFCLSFGVINIEAFGIVAAYGDDTEQFNNAIGFYLLAWGFFTFMNMILTLKSTFMFFMVFFLLSIVFFVLAAAYMTGNETVMRTGGVFAIITSIFGLYNAFAGVADRYNSYFVPHVIPLPVFGGK